jgi:tetratricopeptide (TPR) repeat protein
MMAVLVAGVSAASAPRNLGYGDGADAVREGRELVLDTVIEGKGGIVKAAGDVVTAYFTDPRGALRAAIDMQKKAGGSRGARGRPTIRIAIHYGPGSVDAAGLHGAVAVFAAEATRIAKAGRIYVSSGVYHHIHEMKVVEFIPVSIPEGIMSGQFSFYEAVWSLETESEAALPNAGRIEENEFALAPFIHGRALVDGTKGPCFYCGSRRHHTRDCPSKQLPSSARGLDKLGYLAMDEINRLFSIYLVKAGADLPATPEPAGKDREERIYLAPWGFYELKRAFQLRFLTVIWNASQKDDWFRARESRREGFPEGGTLWLARDCITLSQFDEAERFLMRYGRQNPWDYRTLCGLGFVKIERGNYGSAADLFNEALDRQLTPLQRTYILLLLSRVYELAADAGRAHEMLREALRLEPYCPEGRFEEVIGYFRLSRQAEAVSRLMNLVQSCREYYVAALISPELTAFHSVIMPEFEKLVARTGRDSQANSQEALSAIAALKGFVPDEDEDFSQVLSMEGEMRELSDKRGALFNYYDAVHKARRITSACARIERDREERVAAMIREVEGRARRLLRGRIAPARIARLVQPVLDGLRHLRETLRAREPFARCIEGCERLSKVLDSLEVTARRIEARTRFLMVCGRFFKDVASVSFAGAATALVLFPGTVRCLDILQPGQSLLDTSELWLAQKGILALGGLAAVVFALFHMFTGD